MGPCPEAHQPSVLISDFERILLNRLPCSSILFRILLDDETTCSYRCFDEVAMLPLQFAGHGRKEFAGATQVDPGNVNSGRPLV